MQTYLSVLTPTLLQFQRHDLLPSGGDSHETYFGAAYQFRHQSPIAAKHSRLLDSKFEILGPLCIPSPVNTANSRGSALHDRIERKMTNAIISLDLGSILFSATKILNFMVYHILHSRLVNMRNAVCWESRESNIILKGNLSLQH